METGNETVCSVSCVRGRGSWDSCILVLQQEIRDDSVQALHDFGVNLLSLSHNLPILLLNLAIKRECAGRNYTSPKVSPTL